MRSGRIAQDGTTLIELLVTVMIISVSFVALLGGLWTAVVASTSNVKLATAEATVRAYGEFMKRATYANCATTYSSSGFVVPTGYAASLTAITYWNPDASTPAFESDCQPIDGGMQLLSLRVVSSDGRADETIQVVKRK